MSWLTFLVLLKYKDRCSVHICQCDSFEYNKRYQQHNSDGPWPRPDGNLAVKVKGGKCTENETNMETGILYQNYDNLPFKFD